MSASDVCSRARLGSASLGVGVTDSEASVATGARLEFPYVVSRRASHARVIASPSSGQTAAHHRLLSRRPQISAYPRRMPHNQDNCLLVRSS